MEWSEADGCSLYPTKVVLMIRVTSHTTRTPAADDSGGVTRASEHHLGPELSVLLLDRPQCVSIVFPYRRLLKIIPFLTICLLKRDSVKMFYHFNV